MKITEVCKDDAEDQNKWKAKLGLSNVKTTFIDIT